jgi:hypothetical protein
MPITADELKKQIIIELQALGFSFDENGDLIPPTSDKEAIKDIHKPSREIGLKKGTKVD